MSRYVVLETASIESLETQVENHMKMGYWPMGGVEVRQSPITNSVAYFYQAMVHDNRS